MSVNVVLITHKEEDFGPEDAPLSEVIRRTLKHWNEDEKGPQCFAFRDEKGFTLATILRDQLDPEVAHMLHADGWSMSFRCHYVLGADGYYAATEITPLFVARMPNGERVLAKRLSVSDFPGG